MHSHTKRKLDDFEPEISPRGARDVEVDFGAADDLLRLAWRQGLSHFPCITSRDRNLRGGTIVHAESFTAMVIADLLMDQGHARGMLVRNVVSMLEVELGDEDLFYFFKEHERLPADADCTALGLSVMLLGGARISQRAHASLDKLLANCDPDGVVETYFDPTGEREGIIDPVVCCNVLFLAYQLGRGDEAQATLEFVHRTLVEESYLEGSRYYHSPDTFLYFLGRVVSHFPQTRELLLEPLRDAVRKRLGISSHTLDVAQRSLLCTWLEIDDEGELDRLVQMQEGDGNWPNDALFRYGRKKVYFGSRAVVTAFAVTAIMAGKEQRDALRRPRDADADEEIVGEVVVGGENVTFVSFQRAQDS